METPSTFRQESKTGSAKAKERKRRIVQTAFYLVGGIAFLGVAFIVGVVLWGIRVRQRVARQSPNQPARDPLWYLRRKSSQPKGPPLTGPQTEDPEGDSDGKNSAEDGTRSA